MRIPLVISTPRLCAAIIALLAISLFVPTPARAQGQKIQFSEPDAAITSSNSSSLNPALERLNPTPSDFHQAQEELFGSMKNAFRPPDSTQGVLSLPPPQAPQMDKHTRDLIERRRNWAFTDLSDLSAQTSMEETFGIKEEYGSDSHQKKDATAVEKYYESLTTKAGQKRDQLNTELLYLTVAAQNGTNAAGGVSLSSLNSLSPIITPASDDAIDDLSIIGRDSSSATKPAGFDPRGPSPEEIRRAMADQQRAYDFKRLLDRTLPPLAPAHVAGSGMALPDLSRPANYSSSMQAGDELYKNATKQTQPFRSSINPAFGFIDPTASALHSRIFDDPTSAALGMPNPVKPAAPTKPAETIREMLDPASAAIMKPKF